MVSDEGLLLNENGIDMPVSNARLHIKNRF